MLEILIKLNINKFFLVLNSSILQNDHKIKGEFKSNDLLRFVLGKEGLKILENYNNDFEYNIAREKNSFKGKIEKNKKIYLFLIFAQF